MVDAINLSPNGLLGVLVGLFILMMLGLGFTCMVDLGNVNLKYTQTKLQLGKEY